MCCYICPSNRGSIRLSKVLRMAGNVQLVRIDTNILPRAQLLIVFSGLACALLICFVDQNAIGIALPTIGADLHSATTIGWAGTSNLIANTSFQVLYGRLSDIFGRKVVFLSAIGFLAVGDLLCGVRNSQMHVVQQSLLTDGFPSLPKLDLSFMPSAAFPVSGAGV